MVQRNGRVSHLAVKDNVAASTQNQALGALLFLYQDVLRQEIGELNAVRARRPKRVPLLRMKDIDLERGQLTVRGGKGDKDRFVMLPDSTKEGLQAQMQWRRTLHARDLASGQGRVELSTALRP